MAKYPSVLIVDDDRTEDERLTPGGEPRAGQDHILVIDDEPDMLGLYKACLSGYGYRVTAASDGAAGVDIAKVDPPTLVILDIMMPGMSGLEVCDRLRGDSRTEEIPILVVSGRDAVEDRVRCLRKGVDDYIAKPFEYEELVARVEALIRRSTVRTRAVRAPLSPDERRRLQILRNALRDGPDSLVPRYDIRMASGYAYPAAGEVMEEDAQRDPVVDLEFLHANGYLERSFHDVVLTCPFCGHHDVHLREVCPACGSADLRPVDMIHHYRCAFVGPAEAFRQEGKMVCPKCRVQLRHIGLEYEKPTETVQCNGCDRGFQEPDVAARCRSCDRPFPPEQAERRRIYSYALTSSGRFAAEVGSFMTSPGGPDFTEEETEVFRPEFFRELVAHEVARGTSLGHPTALLRVGVRGMNKLVDTRGPAAGRRALHAVVRNIRTVLRNVDKIGRMRSSDFVVLLPGADTRAAVSLARSIAESFNQRMDESLEKIGLSYAWAVHPQDVDVDDAQVLLGRVMEETPTAYLGEPEAYETDRGASDSGDENQDGIHDDLHSGPADEKAWLEPGDPVEDVLAFMDIDMDIDDPAAVRGEDLEDGRIDEEYNALVNQDFSGEVPDSGEAPSGPGEGAGLLLEGGDSPETSGEGEGEEEPPAEPDIFDMLNPMGEE